MGSNKNEPATAGAAASKKVTARTIELKNPNKSVLLVYDDSVTFRDDRLDKEETFTDIKAAIHEFSARSMKAQLPESYDEVAFELNRALVTDLKALRQLI